MCRDLRRRRTGRIRRGARGALSRIRDAVVGARHPFPGRGSHRFDVGARVDRTLEGIERGARSRGSSAWRRCCARGRSGRRYATLRRMRATTADREQSAIYTYLICLAAWAIPGAGHLLLGRLQKGLSFLIALPLMFIFGLWLEGRLFPVEISQPLVALAALADMGIGIPFFIARGLGAGAGRVVALTYEYGNAFLIVAGLMNMLVVLDAFDVAQGRK